MESGPIFTIERNAMYGRYITAARDIKEGELIIRETPTVLGATTEGFHVCFRCCKILKTSVQVCRNCDVAILCSNACQGVNHSGSECAALKGTGLKALNLLENPQITMPLRCLMLRKYDPNMWTRFLAMEAHMDKRRDTPIWIRHKEYTEKPLKNLQQLTEDDLEQEIVEKICGILDVNSFEVRPSESDGNLLDSSECLRGIYVEASLMTHDCVGNTQLSIDDDFNMTVHASRAIPAGETIFFNYGNCLKNTYERRCHLRQGKYFDCACSRCSDPSELGTYMSSIRCNTCKSGLVVPTVPLSDIYRTPWICQCCKTVYKGVLIKTSVDRIKEQITSWDPANIEEGEKLLKRLEITLAPQHYLILELKQNLVPLYECNLFSTWAMERKIQFCKDVVDALKIVEPGISRLQGLALFQLHSTQLNLANKLYQCKEMSASKYLEALLEAERNLIEAIKYLLYEPKRSPEGRLTRHAIADLKILRSMLGQMKTLCGESKLSEKDDLLHQLAQKKKTVS
ncbi:hypothetical protein Trydic_g19845 [Trypoxylus dichotomus]